MAFTANTPIVAFSGCVSDAQAVPTLAIHSRSDSAIHLVDVVVVAVYDVGTRYSSVQFLSTTARLCIFQIERQAVKPAAWQWRIIEEETA